MKRWLPNLIGFQLVWLSTVAGAGMGLWWPGLLVLAVFAAWQLGCSHCPKADLKLMLVAVTLGLLVDSAWIWLGLLNFASPLPWTWLAPIWILVLWAGFALTLNHSMAGLRSHPVLAVAFGALGGPLAYWIAASAWKAATVAEGPWPYLAIGLAWALMTPALLYLSVRFGGVVDAAEAADARA